MASRGNRSGGGGRAVVPNELVINVSAGETRVAILEQNTFTELYIERDSDRNVAGMVAKGRVTRVLPGMQAGFVDIGLEKAAFLYVGDYLDENGQLDGDEGGDARPRRSRGRGTQRPAPSIETLLEEGQEITVQVAKEPIGTKGARITSHVSIAGRHLVLTPWSKRVGVSRRIDSDKERRRLREIVSRVRPKDLGFIIRTAGEGTREADLEADVKYLTAVWEEIRDRQVDSKAPAILYEELSLPLRAIRDFANAKTKRILVDDPETHEKMERFLSRFVADPKPRLELYRGELPLFDSLDLEAKIDASIGRKIWLKSGGYLIVDQSEALTAIDVNTGRYVGKRDLEETVLKTNLEAVQEVVYQLRFRNIGGLIIIDLIDMESTENREKVYRALQDALRQDKARTNILKISELGLVEMTRKRTRENLVQQLCEPCAYCEGRGYVISAESMAYKVLREIRKDLPRFCGRRIAVSASPRVAEMLLGRARKATAKLGEDLGREIEVRARPGLHQEQFEVEALDEGAPVTLDIPWLGGGNGAKRSNGSGDTAEPEAATGDGAGASVAEAVSGSPAAESPPRDGGGNGGGDDGDRAAEPPTVAAEPPTVAAEPPTVAAEPPTVAAELPTVAAEPAGATPDPPDDDDDESVRGEPSGAAEAVDEQGESPILPRLQNREES